MNVLDRCSKPRSLLHQLRQHVAPNGVLICSVPLPLNPAVEANELQRSAWKSMLRCLRCDRKSRVWIEPSEPLLLEPFNQGSGHHGRFGVVPVEKTLPLSFDPAPCLCCGKQRFERSAVALDLSLFQPLGWQVIGYTRLPYLSQGDHQRYSYWLDQAIFVCVPR